MYSSVHFENLKNLTFLVQKLNFSINVIITKQILFPVAGANNQKITFFFIFLSIYSICFSLSIHPFRQTEPLIVH